MPSETHNGRVSDGLYSDILSGILNGEYPPKSTLPAENRLARNYGIARSVVRAALKVLKQEGIIRSQQGSGTVVVGFDSKKLALLNRNAHVPEMQECYACRLAIEPEIAAILASRQSDRATAYLRLQLDALNGRAGGASESDGVQSASDAEFHARLAQFTGNAFFSEIMNSMRPHMVFYMNIKNSLTSMAQERHVNLTKQEHKAVISAILKQDCEAARTLMRAHITNGWSRIF